MSGQTYQFQAEINQLLSLIINTFYSNKEVFLRELISNASDALDKVRYESLTNPDVLGSQTELAIKLLADKEAKTLTVWDSGIGMTREDLVRNLGTIAHSGTRAFMEALQTGSKPDLNLIGQFGVGFYSAFLVAHKVQVFTKHNDDMAYLWESDANGSFTITPFEETFERGTKIVLHLKEDQAEYADEQRIKGVIRKHSQYCGFPIRLWVEKEVEVPVAEETPETPAAPEATEEEGATEEVEDSPTPKEPKTERKKVNEWEHLNTQPPIWTRKPEDVTEDEYKNFYRSISGDWEDPLVHKHFVVDGSVQFKSLLYIPKRAPFDMFNVHDRKRNNIKLYVRKVLIMDETNDLLPDYFSFIQGVVDSDDLPLNVSREMLQQNSILNVIKRNLIKKSIELMTDMAQSTEDTAKEQWKTFYDNFSKNLKIAIHEDAKNRSKLAELLQFRSTKSGDDTTTLSQYIDRMKENQKDIYFLAGESLKAIQGSPLVAKLVARDLEVLFFTDPIDEYMTQALQEYQGKKFVNISRDGLELPLTEEEKKTLEERTKDWEPVCTKIHNVLGSDKVVSVKVVEGLGDVPCVLVSDRYGWTANMERIMKAQTLNRNMMGMMSARKVLEINPDHPLLREVKRRLDENKDIASLTHLLYETVLLDSGFALEEPSKYATRIYKLLQAGLSGLPEEEEQPTPPGEETTPAAPTCSLEELD